MRSTLVTLLSAAAVPLLAACGSGSPTGADETNLTSVSPVGGAIGVSIAGRVTITFDHAIMAGMQQYAALHEGEITGPAVTGTWWQSGDAKTLTFTPAIPLEPKTKYTIHLGGGMVDAQGQHVSLGNGTMMGGQHATGSMMTGGGMMQGNTGMMGAGWASATGSYGMSFSFTTGSS